MLIYAFLFTLIAIGGIAIYFVIKSDIDARRNEKLEQEKIVREREKIVQQKIKIHKKAIRLQQDIIEKYGEPDYSLYFKYPKQENMKYNVFDIGIFSKNQVVAIYRNVYPFEDIISCKIVDDCEIVHGEVKASYITQTSTGSLIKRTIGGALIGGGVGAVIGASSASKTTTTDLSQANDTHKHNYILFVGIRDFEQPIVEIPIGNNIRIAIEIEALFNLIIDKNQRLAENKAKSSNHQD